MNDKMKEFFEKIYNTDKDIPFVKVIAIINHLFEYVYNNKDIYKNIREKLNEDEFNYMLINMSLLLTVNLYCNTEDTNQNEKFKECQLLLENMLDDIYFLNDNFA